MNSIKDKKISLFWILQISGWILYWATHLLTSISRQGWNMHQFTRYSSSSFAGFLVTLLLRYIYRKLKYQKHSILSILLSGMICSLLAANILVWVSNLIRIPLWGSESTLFGKLSLMAYLRSVFWWIIPFIGWTALYFGIKFWQEGQQQKERTEKAFALAQSAQLQMLRYQLNPHFLFNSLNSIRALIKEDRDRAKIMITELSEFLRYALISRKYQDIPLKNEIEAITHYLTIEKIRYEDKLEINFDIPEETGEHSIPCFLLHPLVENAVKHGMKTSPMPLRISIKAFLDKKKLWVEIINTGKWIAPVLETVNSFDRGLNNVRKRLEDACSDNFSMDIYEKNDQVHIKIAVCYN